MHEHTTELVTNLLLPSWLDAPRSGASGRSKSISSQTRRRGARSDRGTTVVQPLTSIDIIDGEDYYDLEDISNRLRSSMREPHVEQLVLSELQLEPCVIQALVNLLKTRDGEGDAWEAVFLEFCRGDVETAIREILALDNVKKLEIATGMSDRTAMQALSTAPRTYQTLQQLSLFTHIDEQAIEWLSEGFLRNAGISTLCFVKCTFLEGSTEPLARFLRSTQTIEVLRIDRCIMQDTDGNLGTILDSLAGHTSLNDLFIGGPLCEQSYLAISKLLTHNRLMFKLSLQNRSDLASSGRPSVCQDPTIQWMEDPLSSNSTLKILDLSQRCLNDDGMKVLCKALCSDASRLEEIRLHENHIGNIGAQHFASSIPSMTSSLRRILLHRNPFGEPGAKALLAAVRESCAVRELTIPSMGRSSLMTKYQRLISYETMLSCGGKHLLKGTIQNNLDSSLPAGLWPLIFERAGQQMSTPYSERQLSGSDAWKLTQQADLVFYLMKGAAESIFPRKRPDETS